MDKMSYYYSDILSAAMAEGNEWYGQQYGDMGNDMGDKVNNMDGILSRETYFHIIEIRDTNIVHFVTSLTIR